MSVAVICGLQLGWVTSIAGMVELWMCLAGRSTKVAKACAPKLCRRIEAVAKACTPKVCTVERIGLEAEAKIGAILALRR